MAEAFPERIHYSSEESPDGAKIQDWETADELLSLLDTNGQSFACFEKPDGSYFQCAGNQARVTAELRINEPLQKFRHYVFGLGKLSGREEKVATTDYEVTVDSTQVLQISHVRQILRPWLETGRLPGDFTMTDVTERFV
jgi:hypothetical protein